eukprot:364175-Chlamydomonas_euryale.AAC.1
MGEAGKGKGENQGARGGGDVAFAQRVWQRRLKTRCAHACPSSPAVQHWRHRRAGPPRRCLVRVKPHLPHLVPTTAATPRERLGHHAQVPHRDSTPAARPAVAATAAAAADGAHVGPRG